MSFKSPKPVTPSSPEEKLTPMMRQYLDVKNTLPPNTLLLFRLGDFFELFHDDAVEASKILGITLTKRQNYPMAGIPHHAAENYAAKLLAAGKKVAICDQTEPAQTGKLVARRLTRILTPGTILSDNQLESSKNHYLLALNTDKKQQLHAAWLDLTTGEFKIATDPKPEHLLPILTALNPAEILLPENLLQQWQNAPHENAPIHNLHHTCTQHILTELPQHQFDPATATRTLTAALKTHSLDGFGIPPDHPALPAAAALILYTTDTLRAAPQNLTTLQEYRTQQTLLLDPATLRNLEIFQSTNGTRQNSLLATIDRTRTPLGARLLEQWLAAPTLDTAEIARRSNTIAELLAKPQLLAQIRDTIQHIRDIHRILSRLQNKLRNPRELGAIRDTLAQIPPLQQTLLAFPPPNTHIQQLAAQLLPLPKLHQLLQSALADTLPNDLADGNYIRPGYDAELDRLKSLTTDNKTWLSNLERAEQESTGIKSLKVKFTGNFGYYIEVTKANLHLVPSHYIRRQTTVGGERYITEDLRKKEKEIFHAEENTLAREHLLFEQLLTATLDESIALTQNAHTLAQIDLLAAWTQLAREQNYTQPIIDQTDTLEITEGRHPVVEQTLQTLTTNTPANSGTSTTFVPNDTTLGATTTQIALLTGPNMAGKSTYIRQTALITLLAQIGSWVPAKTCHIGLVDRIFSRVGASDDLARGNSTFMVEMNETANILNNSTPRSLIILDEIGRGTSTYDGLAIAWSVIEHLHSDPERGPRTLFATHYQELTQLEQHLPRLKNYSVAIKEWNDDIIFVRRVIPGPADRSYGIQVARLAGIPPTVITRAKEILTKLESDTPTITLTAPIPITRPRKKITIEPNPDQLSLL